MDCRNALVFVIVRSKGDKRDAGRAKESRELPDFPGAHFEDNGCQCECRKESKETPPVETIGVPAERPVSRVASAQPESADAPNDKAEEDNG